MTISFNRWDEVARLLRVTVDEQQRIANVEKCSPPTPGESRLRLNEGQRKSVVALAERLPKNGVIIADEVGMGKTRIVVAVIDAVVKAGGRVAVVVPPGLGYQWNDELREGGVTAVPPILRSYWSYLQAWAPQNSEEQRPWFKQKVVVLSHAFANWRLRDKSDAWRTALLPEVYAQVRKHRKQIGRLPRSYHDHERLYDPWVKNAASSIVASVPQSEDHPGRLFLEKLNSSFQWPQLLEDDYRQGSDLRKWLEKTVGLGLGFFDLIVIDEAHKSRGTDSGLSRLLNSIVCSYREQSRRICMTATPVELEAEQWSDPLKRIGVEPPTLDRLLSAIGQYSDAIQKLRYSWRVSEESRNVFYEAAAKFQDELKPYVLRRDKREDEHVQKFRRNHSPLIDYRQRAEAKVELVDLTPEWKKAVCGAEALSFLANSAEATVAAQRLRLTLGNGHGIATFLDHAKNVTTTGAETTGFDAEMNTETKCENQEFTDPDQHDDKRSQRAKWWRNVVQQAFDGKDHALFDHPGIRKAVDVIERFTSPEMQEKVLVFGRFTEPMRTLTSLLNAREMLRRIYRSNLPWPQTKVHEIAWPAVRAAWVQLRDELSLPTLVKEELDRKLDEQYRRLERSREKFRESIVKRLQDGLQEIQVNQDSKCSYAFRALSDPANGSGSEDLALVSRALIELSGGATQTSVNWMEEISSQQIAEAFREMIESALDRDDPDADEDADGETTSDELLRFWDTLKQRIKDEYGENQGGLARFMFGETRPHSRRLIQQAFNRRNCFPQVLVAQSTVGREGLNLHKACKTVVLLHPEWNPGVVEQQIGRVDRVNSHWCKVLDEHLDRAGQSNDVPEACPQIEFIPIVFAGTYDEHNWSVLQQRWDDLRAQLHGVVIPRYQPDADAQELNVLKELEDRAPCFSPTDIKTSGWPR